MHEFDSQLPIKSELTPRRYLLFDRMKPPLQRQGNRPDRSLESHQRNSPPPPGQRAQVQWMLSEVMGRHRISQKALAEASDVRVASIHAMYHERTESVTLVMLASVLTGLRNLTGVSYGVSDLLKINFPDS